MPSSEDFKISFQRGAKPGAICQDCQDVMDMDGDLRQSDGAGVGEDAEVDHDVGEVEPDQEPGDM